MKKLLFLILTLLLCCTTVFALSACNLLDAPSISDGEGEDGGDEGDHTHAYSLETVSDTYLKDVATCQSPAVYFKSCECGAPGTETFTSGTIGEHVFDIADTSEKYFASAATCTSPAMYKYSCTCGEASTETFPHGDMIPHDYDGYVCKDCGYEKSSDGLIYELFEGNDYINPFYTVVGYTEDLHEDVHIANYNGLPVRVIAENVFKNCDTIKSLHLGDAFTDINNDAFYGCDNLESVHFGKNFYSLGYRAFSYCPSLYDITISEENENLYILDGCLITIQPYEQPTLVAAFNTCSLTASSEIVFVEKYAFHGLTEITSIVIPDSVTEIFANAIIDCPALEEITLGSGLEYLGEYAISDCPTVDKLNFNCTNLTGYHIGQVFKNTGFDTDGVTLTVANNVKVIPHDLFVSYADYSSDPVDEDLLHIKLTDVVFEANSELESIGYSAFYNLDYLTSLTLPASIREIGYRAFADCSSLASISMADTAILLKEECFADCTALTNLTLGNGAALEERVFRNCSALETLIIPDGITTVAYGAFQDCTALKSVSLGKSLAYIPYFSASTQLTEMYYNAISAADDVSAGITWAGRDSGGITLTIGKDVVSIPKYAFAGINVKYLEFEEGSVCESIGEFAFSGCANLLRAVLPASLTSVGDYAFNYCKSLVEVYNLSELTFEWNNGTGLDPIRYYSSLSEESKLVFIDDYVFFDDGVDIPLLVNYTGRETDLTLPRDFKGGKYSINKHALLNSEIINLVVPGNVISVGWDAFDISSLENVVIEDGVNRIETGAFSSFGLKTIIIPESVEIMESKVFHEFAQTQIFAAVSTLPDGWFISDNPYYSFYGPDSTVYWYSEATPVTEGNYWHYVDGEPTPW